MPIFSNKKKVKALPYPVYLFSVLGVVLCGFVTSVYLSISHYKVYTDLGYRSFCAISKAINCDTVSQSPYSIFLGIPVPVWGVIGYTFILLLLKFASTKEAGRSRIWAIIFWLSIAFSSYSAILAYISSFFIGSYCALCIVTYGVNFLMLFLSWIIHRRFSTENIFKATKADFVYLRFQRRKLLPLIVPFAAMVAFTIFFFPAYWEYKPPSASSRIPTGVTEEGHPWIGSKEPILEIIEFSDYQCFQCKKMHFYLRQLVANNTSKIRLIHRNFPLDHEYNFIIKKPFHVGSGKMALMSIYASTVGKFWEMNDLLYSYAGNTDSIDIASLAVQLNLDPVQLSLALTNRKIKHKLRVDIWTGMKHRITGTPSYIINGEVHQGSISPETIKKYLN